jgi:hypothetical protein
MIQNISLLVITLVILLGFFALQIFIIMTIWNVLIKKFPSQNIQKLNFWDALLLSIFFTLLTSPSIINTTNNYIQKIYQK